MVLTSDEVSLPDRVDAGSQPSQDKEAYDEWCEVRDYEDLSSDPVFGSFHQWIEEFESIALGAERTNALRDFIEKDHYPLSIISSKYWNSVSHE